MSPGAYPTGAYSPIGGGIGRPATGICRRRSAHTGTYRPIRGGYWAPAHSYAVHTGVIPVQIGLYMSPAEASYRYILAGQGKDVASRTCKQRLCTLINVNNSSARFETRLTHSLPEGIYPFSAHADGEA